MGILGEPPRVASLASFREVREGYVSCVRDSTEAFVGKSICSEVEVSGGVDLSLVVDTDMAAGLYGKRVKVTIELDSE